jgi:proteasome component ECM29
LSNDALKAQTLNTVQSLIDTIKASRKSEERQGSILALGFAISRAIYRYPSTFFDSFGKQLEIVVPILLESGPEERIVVFKAFGELGRYARLEQIPNTPASKILQVLIDWLKETKDVKVLEAGFFAISHFCVGNQNLAPQALDFFKTLPSQFSKQPDVLLTIGQSLRVLLFGFQSDQMNLYLDLVGVEYKPSVPDETILHAFLDHLISMASPESSSANRKTTAVWLLCMLKDCGDAAAVKGKLQQIHSCFISLLGDRDGACAN